MKKISSLHKKWIEDAAYRKECDALEVEFASASVNSDVKLRPMAGERDG